MKDPMLPISVDQLLDAIRKLLEVFKKALAWLGILVLPEDNEDYPPRNTTTEAITE